MKRFLNRLPSYLAHISIRRYCNNATTEKLFLKDCKSYPTVDLLPISKYGGEVFVTLLYGDSLIGKQGSNYIQTLVRNSKVPITLEKILMAKTKPNETSDDIYSILRNRTAIMVDLELQLSERGKRLKYLQQFKLHTCCVKLKSYCDMGAKMDDIDVWVFRQNNTGDFLKLEYEPTKGIVETLVITSESLLREYLETVFQYVIKYKRKKITLAHQVQHFPKSEGMFRELARTLHAEKYNTLEMNEMSINELVLNILKEPQQFDVICTLIRYGDMISAILSGICGGAGLFSAVDMGNNFAIFKPLQTKLSLSECHTLSPYGIVKACIDLLIYLNKYECAATMTKELENVIHKGVKTEEFGGTDSSDFVICSIANNLCCYNTSS